MYTVSDGFMYVLGPILIFLALVMISCLSYTFFTILLPMMTPGGKYSMKAIIHEVFFFTNLYNVLFNYYMCVTTINYPGKHYEIVVRELANATRFEYPETIKEKQAWRMKYREMVVKRNRLLNEFNLTHENTPSLENLDLNVFHFNGKETFLKNPIGLSSNRTKSDTIFKENQSYLSNLMFTGAMEWSYCDKTEQPKPPRSHYDHITNALILNMDHYCPWMFNTVGYFNYRYFCNFLLYVSIGMCYGAMISFRPFMLIESSNYFNQTHSNKGLFENNPNNINEKYNDITPDDLSWKKNINMQHIYALIPSPYERTPVALTFMLCLSIGLAVLFLFAFHLYLVFTAQTTIEFHGNCTAKKMAKHRGFILYRNPYHLGFRRNFQQVWGSGPVWKAFFPSRRQPEFLPLPIAGEFGKRYSSFKEEKISVDTTYEISSKDFLSGTFFPYSHVV